MSLRKKAAQKSRQLGQGMTEYIIIVALIAIAAIAVFGYFGDTVTSQVAGMTEELAGNDGGANITTAGTHAAAATTNSANVSNGNGLGTYNQ
ncbi:MAG: hypothetical protein V3V18_08150 [Methylococcales bacterium]